MSQKDNRARLIDIASRSADGTNTMYYAIEVAIETRIKEAKPDDLHKVARFLKRELTVEQTKDLARILGLLK